MVELTLAVFVMLDVPDETANFETMLRVCPAGIAQVARNAVVHAPVFEMNVVRRASIVDHDVDGASDARSSSPDTEIDRAPEMVVALPS